ncbi:HAMP domain-containing sensor histidine kinase [Brevundimonas sp.]|uniref:sensor histidine kinase n=1 Tax=Brevundimonas sp. TaxID=1871086 RepID=UPI00260896C2|nr:HAMP domain-containing sensor histidine kinase [Brevundimonas sp.]
MPSTLFARLVALLVVTLLATQFIGGVLFFLVTPPPGPPGPPTVHVSEVADGLARARAATDGGSAEPEPTRNQSRQTWLEPLLAARLGVAPDDVRLWQDRFPGMPPGGFDQTRIDPVIIAGYRAAVRTEAGWFEVSETLHDPFDLLRRMGTWLIVSLACIAPVAVLLGARLTSPITAFAQAAERLGHDPYAPGMRQSGPAEVQLAITAFNDMQGRLRAYVDDRVRMVGAIAHDLRTPLTRLRLQLQVLSPAARARAENEIERMDRMVEGALAFVKDAGVAPERTRLHLLSLVEAVSDDFQSVDSGASVEVEPGADPVVLADESGLRRVVGNLVSNAVRYGGAVRCRVQVDPGWAVLQVDDNGPGLDESDLQRVFDPYVRLGDDGEGVGLGLAIVRSIVHSHGGEVTLENLASGGLRAQVRLPAGVSVRAMRGSTAAF